EITPNEWAESVAENVGEQLNIMRNPPGRVGELFPSYRGLVHKAVQIARARAAEGLPLTDEAAVEQAKQLIESTRPQGPRSPFTKPVIEVETVQPAVG